MITDCFSDSDACSASDITFDDAKDRTLTRQTVIDLMQENMCAADEGTDFTTADTETLPKLHMLQIVVIQDIYTALKHAAPDSILLRPDDTDTPTIDPTTGAVEGSPLFLFSLSLILLLHVSGKTLQVFLPAHEMGIPGTSLTLRRAMRGLLEDEDCTVHRVTMNPM